jgi:hypothetical protein
METNDSTEKDHANIQYLRVYSTVQFYTLKY